MLSALLVMLVAADPENAPQPEAAPAPQAAVAPIEAAKARPDERARDTAVLGVVTALAAGALAATIPLADPRHPGTTPLSLYLGSAGFVMVAFVRPAVFFSGQPSRPPPTTLNNALRVLGTATALAGLVSFIAGFALRPSQPDRSAWAMVGAAGIEAVSAAAFSIDALLGLP